VKGKPMVRMVIDNILAPNVEAQYIYVVQRAHFEQYGLKELFESVTPNCKIVCLDSLTEGPACTCLAAKDFIDSDVPLLIANSDQYVEWDASSFYDTMAKTEAYGGILCFVDEERNPKWSFARTADGTINSQVVEVAEKKPISDLATVGIYYWRTGKDFLNDAHEMIKKNIRVNNEFYVAPVYTEGIEKGKLILTHFCKKMWGTGTPEDLKIFEDNFKGDL